MTFEKKCLIELSDILAVQYQCAKCRAAVSIPIDKLNPEYAAARIIRECPHCQTSSGFVPGTNESRAFVDFNVALKNVIGVMEGRNFKLLLDIKCSE